MTAYSSHDAPEPDPPDRELLDRYIHLRDQAAFRILVERHVALVQSVARRVTAASDLAADVTQSVFIRLAERAATLPRTLSLTAWLHRTTRSLAIDLVRAEARRKRHELSHSHDMSVPDPMPAWSELAPVIDELVDALPATDREVLLLRYYDQRSLRSVGRQLGIEESAAGKRAARALQRLRQLLARRGIATSAAALEVLLPAHAASPASQALTLSILNATRGITPVIPGVFTTALITMTTKTIVTTALGVALIGSAAYLTTYHHNTPQPSATDRSGGKETARGSAAPGEKSATVSSASSEARPRPQRAAGAGISPPSGISPKNWAAAGDILTHMANGTFLINKAATLPPDKLQQLKDVLHLSDSAVSSISDLISAKVAAQQQQSADFLRDQMNASTDLQELIALGELHRAGQITPEQTVRYNEIGAHYSDVFGDFQAKQIPWYEDSAFLDGVKASVQPDQASGFDSYVQEQRDSIHEAQAFDQSQRLATELNLDKDQRQAIYQEIFNGNNTPEAIASHLSPEQTQIFNTIRNTKTLTLSSP